ncbi:MAG: ribbon-helix-helix protein, CopG family [Bryobacteraceae bacterium]
METIQVVIDAKLLKEADVFARRSKINRSALIRDALREHLKKAHLLDLEEKERRGYLAKPDSLSEAALWEKEASWPDR